jgi:hypothetical protein
MARPGLLLPLAALSLAACPGQHGGAPAPGSSSSEAPSSGPAAAASPASRDAGAARDDGPDAFGTAFTVAPSGTMHWSPDGQRMAVGSWILGADGKRLAALPGRPRGFSPDSRHAVFAEIEAERHTWPLLEAQQDPDGAARLTLWSDGQSSSLEQAAVDRWVGGGGALLLREAGGLALWTAATRERKTLSIGPAAKVAVRAVTPDGKVLIYQSGTRIHLLDLASNYTRATFDDEKGLRVEVSPDGQRFLLCSSGKTQQIIEVGDPSRRVKIESSADVCSLDPTGKLAALTHADKGHVLKVFEVATGNEVASASLLQSPRNLRWSSDGAHLAWGQPRGGVSVLEIKTRSVREVPGHHPAMHPSRPLLAVQREDTVQIRSLGGLGLLASVPGQSPGRLQGNYWASALLSTAHASVWSLWDPETGALRERIPVLTSLDPAQPASWGGVAVTPGYLSYTQWQERRGKDGQDQGLASMVVVVRRRDGKRLYFRVVQGPRDEHMVVTDEEGHFFADEAAWPLFSIRTPAGERPAPEARARFAPRLVEEFFQARLAIPARPPERPRGLLSLGWLFGGQRTSTPFQKAMRPVICLAASLGSG